MLVRLYTIIALLVLITLILKGSGIEMSIIKSTLVFAFLVVTTRVSVYLLDIIGKKTTSEQESPSHH